MYWVVLNVIYKHVHIEYSLLKKNSREYSMWTCLHITFRTTQSIQFGCNVDLGYQNTETIIYDMVGTTQ